MFACYTKEAGYTCIMSRTANHCLVCYDRNGSRLGVKWVECSLQLNVEGQGFELVQVKD